MARTRKQKPYSSIGHQRAIVGGAAAGYFGGAVGGAFAPGPYASKRAVKLGSQAGAYSGAVAGGVAGHRAYVKRHSNPDGSARVKTAKVPKRTAAQTKIRRKRQRRAAYVAVGGAAALTRMHAVGSRQTKVAGTFHNLGGVRGNKVPAHKANFSRPGRATYRKHGTPLLVKSHHQRAIGSGRGRQHRDRRGRFA